MRWLVWGIMIVLLNGSVTWLSRARASASLGYHLWAALAASTLWIINQLFLVDTMIRGTTSWQLVLVVLFYVILATGASVLMHRYLLSLEKGDMRVGANSGLHPDRLTETSRPRTTEHYPIYPSPGI